MAQRRTIGHFEVNVSRLLGDGGFGKVYRAKDLNDAADECAAKHLILKSESEIEAVESEVKVLKVVASHPSVIQLKDYVEEQGSSSSKKEAWLFMEMATGGELFDRLIDSGNLSEKAVRPFAKAMLEGVKHCHARGVVHRDLKLENIMLCAEDPFAVKLIDFGLAAIVGVDSTGKPNAELLRDPVGTKSYRAPEIATHGSSGYLGPPVDVWSMGIVLFSLASGFFPLEEAKKSDWRFDRLQKDQTRGIGACDSIYAMYKRAVPFTADLRELLESMLTIDVTKRATVDDLLAHKWMNPKFSPESYGMADEDYDEGAIVYRSAGMDMDDEMAEPFEPPMEAFKIMRQTAERFC